MIEDYPSTHRLQNMCVCVFFDLSHSVFIDRYISYVLTLFTVSIAHMSHILLVKLCIDG